jgi:RHS repeat-associated protein
MEDLDPQTEYWSGGFLYLYDGNGNVGQVVTTAGPGDAVRYQYAPYGKRVNTPAPDELEQPFRFSTRFCDGVWGFYHFPRRVYDPQLGRWVSRDPIYENDDRNIYRYVTNAPGSGIDGLGLLSSWFPALWEPCCPECTERSVLYAGTTAYSFVSPDAEADFDVVSATFSTISIATSVAEKNPASCCCSATTTVADPYTAAAKGVLKLSGSKGAVNYIWIKVHCLKCERAFCGWWPQLNRTTWRWEDKSQADWKRCPGGPYVSQSPDASAVWECHRWAEETFCR